jgi:hypothetical protein
MSGRPRSLAGAVRRGLRAAGVSVVFGEVIAGLDTIPVPSAPLASLLARAEQRVHGRRAATVVGPELRVLGDPALVPVAVVVDSADAVAQLPCRVHAAGAAGVTFTLALDLDAPAAGPAPAAMPPSDRWAAAPDDVVDAAFRARRALVLAGPGVVRDSAIPGLCALAAAGRLGVLNTWGAKGVFDWRSRHHLATAGLQARDFLLGGLPESDLVIATGLDRAESPDERWQLVPHVTVAPRALAQLAERWSGSGDWPPVPALRQGLAAVTAQGWAHAGAPLAPSQATRNYGTVLGAVGRVAADAGTAGFWLARTFATVEPGSAQVPGIDEPGFAAAVALVTRLATPSRPVLAVVDGPLSGPTRELLELADSLGAGFAVEAWGDDGEPLDAAGHLRRLERLAVVERSEVASLATDPGQLDRITDVAGPVVAWGGLADG